MTDISDDELEKLEKELSKAIKHEKYGKFGTLLFTIVMVDAHPRATGPLTQHPRFPGLHRRLPANKATANINIDWHKLEPVDCHDDGGLYNRLSTKEKVKFIKFGHNVWNSCGKPDSGNSFEHFVVNNPEDNTLCTEDELKNIPILQIGNCCIFFGHFGRQPPGCAPC